MVVAMVVVDDSFFKRLLFGAACKESNHKTFVTLKKEGLTIKRLSKHLTIFKLKQICFTLKLLTFKRGFRIGLKSDIYLNVTKIFFKQREHG